MYGEKIKMYYDPRGQVIRTVNPDNSEQRVVYGVPAQLTQPGSYTPSPWETYTYDANDLDATSPHYGTPKSAEVDGLGRTIKTLDRLESSNSITNNVRMQYHYDIRGNLLEVKDAYNRKVFEHVYDLRPPAQEGETAPPLKTVHINKGTSRVVFDCTGKPVESRDNKGALILSSYDVLQRPINIWCRDTAPEAVGLRQVMAYGNTAGNNNKGKAVLHYDESGIQETPEYDFKGNLLYKAKQVISNEEIQTAIDASDASGWVDMHCYRVDWDTPPTTSGYYQTDMEYDALNRVMKIKYPEDANSHRKELTTQYNKAGALQKVYFDGSEYVQNIGYNAKGQRLIIAYGNNLMTRYTYNEQTFRLTRMRTERYTYHQEGHIHQYDYEPGTVKQDFAYNYDRVGNIQGINNETPSCGVAGSDSLFRSFEYDALYRLLNGTGRDAPAYSLYPPWNDSYRTDDPNVTSPYSQTYQYDLMGNMNSLHKTGVDSYTRHYEHSNNLVETFTAGPHTYYYTYDSCGNQIQENEERHMQWDYADKLRLYYNQTSLGTEPSVYTHYLYDAAGNRVKKYTRTAGGHWETITYIDGIIEYRENDANEYQSISHVMDDSSRIATIREGSDFGDTTPALKYNLDDHLGSSNVLVDENGTLVNFEEYYPFGETSFGSYAKKRYRFCGKEKDEESGMYYYGARYYSPWLCRFISVDPLAGKYPFYTPYQYAGNQPINFIDLDGLEQAPAQTPAGGAAAPKPAVNNVNQQDGTATDMHPGKAPDAKTLTHTVPAETEIPLAVPAKTEITQSDTLKESNNLNPGSNLSKAEKLDKALEEMKTLVNKNIQYSQQGNRKDLSEDALSALDCSETVSIYLKKLSIMDEGKESLHTGVMLNESQIQKAVGSENIEFVKGSDSPDFIPQKGDIFVWRTSEGGHTGIVSDVDGNKITILEAIGKGGSADEKFNREHGGTTTTNVTRTAIYNVSGKALSKHSGWVGYYRPIIK